MGLNGIAERARRIDDLFLRFCIDGRLNGTRFSGQTADPFNDQLALVADPFALARPRWSLAPCAHPTQMLRRHAEELGALAASNKRGIKLVSAKLLGNRLRNFASKRFDVILPSEGGERRNGF